VVCREGGNEKGVIGGPLTGARTAARRWRTGGGASAPSGYDMCSNEEGRRRGGEVLHRSVGALL
jgi:hypothetical protein